MPSFRPAVRTKVSPEDLCTGLSFAFRFHFGSWPSDECLGLLMAQWALETANGSACYCFNLGNARVSHECDWMQIPGNEIVNGKVIRFAPPKPDEPGYGDYHHLSSFRAFATLEDGCRDYLRLLHRRFYLAWPFLASGDVESFVHALKQQRYFTADEGLYLKGVMGCYKRYYAVALKEPLPEIPPGEDHGIDALGLAEAVSFAVDTVHADAMRELAGLDTERPPPQTETTPPPADAFDDDEPTTVRPLAKTLRPGDSGPEVFELQNLLNAAGATPPLSVDGKFGNLTRDELVAFQGTHGLNQSGAVDSETWSELHRG